MKTAFSLLSFLLILTASMANAQVRFPEITVDDLNGRSQSFPQDFSAGPTIVFIAYKKNHQDRLQDWIEALGLKESGGPAWVEFPVVGRGASLIRSFIDNGMRSGIQSDALRARVFTVYSSKNDFNRPLGITGNGQIYVALVGQNGTVYTLIEGAVSPEKVIQLRQAYP